MHYIGIFFLLRCLVLSLSPYLNLDNVREWLLPPLVRRSHPLLEALVPEQVEDRVLEPSGTEVIDDREDSELTSKTATYNLVSSPDLLRAFRKVAWKSSSETDGPAAKRARSYA